MHHLMDDLKLAFRGFRKTPGVTAVIVLALALGIGVNASCFIFVSSMLLHPFPYPQLERIMTVWESPASMPAERGAVSPANFLDIRERSASFEALSAFRPWNANLSGIGEPERVQACLVTPEFFAALGLAPELGRVFDSADAEPGRPGAIVISRGFWVKHFAASPAVLGKTISLDGAAYTIAGVMPEDLNFPLETQIWAPLNFTAAERQNRATHSVTLIGRLRSGVAPMQAKAELATIGARLASEHPDSNENRALQAIPMTELVESYTVRFLLILMVTAGFVLLLACANVANLLLVRLAGRQRELAIRAAMGASRGRITMQLIVESAFISLVAGVLGLDFAAWNLSASRAKIPAEVYRFVGGLKSAHIDGTVVLMTLALSLLTGLLCALPSLSLVLRDAACNLGESLKESGRTGAGGRARSRLRTSLAVGEVALALILLVGAGAMVRTFDRFLNVSVGFDMKNLLTAGLALPPSQYSSPAQIDSFYARLLDGLGNATVTADQASDGMYIEGRPAPRPGETVPTVQAVTPRFFETLRLPMIAGRTISAADDRDRPLAAVLSKTLVKQYFAGEDPIGRRLRLTRADPRWMTVVGVCDDVTDWFNDQPLPRAYVSFAQSPSAFAMLYIRTPGDPLMAIRSTQAVVKSLDPALALFDVKSEEQWLEAQTSGVRSAASSMTNYALIGLFLAATGIYAVIAYSVVRRTHEIGIRMALGADRATVLRMTLSEALRIGAIGLGIGLPVAYAMIRAMSSVLFGVVQIDPATFAALTLTLALCAVAAGFVPAWRASRLDPVAALRNE